jgi:putative transposase
MVNMQEQVSMTHQCELLSIGRTSVYYTPSDSGEDIEFMHRMDELYTENPTRGTRRLSKALKKQFGLHAGRAKVRSLMARMGITAVYPKRHWSIADVQHKKYPYLLRNVAIIRVNQVWSTDITYIRLKNGFVFLIAVVDWFSRFVLSWRLSTTIDARFCCEVLEEALAKYGNPDIFNTDQGSQFTSEEFTGILLAQGIQISMDGKGRALDNVFVERLWRTVKYENIYLNDYVTVPDCRKGLIEFFDSYNCRREHSSLDYNYPEEEYYGRVILAKAA